MTNAIFNVIIVVIMKGVNPVKTRKIELAGCKLVLKKGQMPKLKVPRSQRKKISRFVDGGVVLAGKGVSMVGDGVKKMSKEMPTYKRTLKKAGKKLSKNVKKRLK